MSLSGITGAMVTNAQAMTGTTKVPVVVSANGGQIGPNGLAQFTLSFAEGFPTAFKTRSTAVSASTSPPPINQSNPMQFNPGVETTFYNSNLGSGLSLAGLADTGTRLIMVFSGVPAGVQFVAGLTVPLGQGTGVLKLVSTDGSGAGPFVAATSGVLTPDANGAILAVYEVLSADSGTTERADIPFQVTYAPGSARLDSLTVTAGLAPTGPGSGLTPAVPRFGGLSTLQVSTLGISPSSIPRGSVGAAYSVVFTATGGVSPFTWSATGLPPGLTMSASGTLSGTPTSPFTGSITVKVIDRSSATVSMQFPLEIVTGFAISTTSVPNGTQGTIYSVPIQTVGGMGMVTFAIATSTGTAQSVVPPGLNLTSAGVLNGTPQTPGSFSFAVTATDGGGNMYTQVYYMSIAPQLLLPTPATLPSGMVGTAYSFAFTGQGGTPPYNFSVDSPPPGLVLTPDGLLSGVPKVGGTFTFAVKLTDQLQASLTKQFQATFTAVTGQLQVAPGQLTFTAAAGGDPPGSQTLQITSGTIPTGFALSLDSGATGSAAPRWLLVQTASGTTPAAIQVSVDPSQVTGTSADARIVISVPVDQTRTPVIVPVHLDITPGVAPKIDVSPSIVRLMSKVANPGNLTQTLLVRNIGGGGSISYTVTVSQKSAWLSVSPASGQTVYNTGVPLTLTLNTQGLQVGSYHDSLHFAGNTTSEDVPVSLYVSPTGAILRLDTRGTRFTARQGAGTTFPVTVRVLNTGDSGTLVNWVAEALSGADWLTLTPSRGTASPGQPASLTLTINPSAANLPAGQNWALVRVTDTSASGSPAYMSVLLDIAPSSSDPQPQLTDGFLYFSSATSAGLAAQTFKVYSSTTTALPFQASASTNTGGSWLTVTTPVSTVSTSTPGVVNVAVNPSGLGPGIYKGQVNVLLGSLMRTKDVTLVMPNATGSAEPDGASAQPRDANCSPTALALTLGSLSSNYSFPAGSPALISVQVNDNCTNAVTDGSVSATFANGEPPLTLQGDGVTNTYVETFAPSAPISASSIKISASRPPLPTVTQPLSGTVQAGSAPILSKGGTVNNLNPRLDAPLSPGGVVQIFGSGLSSQTTPATVIPLLTTLNNTSVLIGGTQVPLYFVSAGQINAELPVGLSLSCCQSVVVVNNGVPSLPDQIAATPVDPGVAVFADSTLIAQRSDGSLVDAAHPAKPGEFLVMYLVGMGATNPPGVTGMLATGPLQPTVVQPTVTIGNLPTSLIFAGLTPGGIGLYQINFQVPTNAPAGMLDVLIQQGTTKTNATKLIVGQ
jgi:uncharacterized protein (TIGR03437 family)